MKYLVTTILLLLVLSASVKAQNVRTINQTFYIKVSGELKFLELKGFLPRSIHNKQRVIDIRFSDSRIKEINRKGIKYFQFKEEGAYLHIPSKISIEYDIELYNYDLQTIKEKKKHYQDHDTVKLDNYLNSKKFQRTKNKKILFYANKITGENDLELVKNTFDFVLDKLSYDNGITENIGAIKALKKGLGDCTEYSDLMVTLCRVKGIPARVVSGMLVKSGENPNHNWCEVYLKDFGWIPFDPTLADSEITKNTTFYNLKNNYIYFSSKREDSKLGSSMWKFKWKGTKSSNAEITSKYTYRKNFFKK